jgi:hypothetical protein
MKRKIEKENAKKLVVEEALLEKIIMELLKWKLTICSIFIIKNH